MQIFNKKGSSMNVYEYAMKVEKDGEHYYRELAAKTNDVGLQKILTMLAEEEVKHFVVFEKIGHLAVQIYECDVLYIFIFQNFSHCKTIASAQNQNVGNVFCH